MIDKIKKYQIVVHNLTVDDELVKKIVHEELEAVNVVDWKIEREIEYEASIPPLMTLYPQRDTIVEVNYVEMT
jgi:hypothetical protein